MGSQSKGGRGLVLLVLLALLGGLGAWNYQRNLEAERAELRPYRGVAEADLDVLIAATEQELAAAERRYEQARDGGVRAAAPGGDRFAAFERAQQRRQAQRELGEQAASAEVLLAGLREERERRAQQGSELQRFLRLVFGARL